MPELPEVETVKSYVGNKITYKKIINIKVLNTKLRWPIDRANIKKIIGKKILKVDRRGKYILLQFEGISESIIIHLGMTGVISFTTAADYNIHKHDHLLMYFEGCVLVYSDVRKFGSIHITDDVSNMFLIKGLGPEPMSEDFNADYLYEKSKNRKCTIKELIMNQNIVVGIGNIYASESLFLSKIHPATIVNRISRAQFRRIITNVQFVLSKAISMGGSTIRDFLNAEGKPGYFAQELLVYKKKYCTIHKKNLISNLKIAGRSSFYCNKCQKEKL